MHPNSDKFQTRSSEFDLGPEWQLEEIELFLERILTRHKKTSI